MRTWCCVATLAIGQLFGEGAASACPGRFAESYLVWFAPPDLLPGEVAIEIDQKDFADNYTKRDHLLPTYKVKRVLRGSYGRPTIEVQIKGGTCNHEVSDGASEQLVLIGRVVEVEHRKLRLVPRYMEYGDPIRVVAEQLLRSREAGGSVQ